MTMHLFFANNTKKCNFTTIIKIRTGNNDYCLVSIHLRFHFVASLGDTYQVHCFNRNRRNIWRGRIKRQIDKYSIKDPVSHLSRWSIFVWKNLFTIYLGIFISYCMFSQKNTFRRLWHYQNWDLKKKVIKMFFIKRKKKLWLFWW